jgi:hypothetical protein
MVLRRAGWWLLRTATLIPVVLVVAVLIRVGAPAVDLTLSARPFAAELARLEPRPFPIAVFGVKREIEYGLAFYRNQVITRYAGGPLLYSEHLLVTSHDQQAALAKILGRRGVQFLGTFPPQGLDFYRVSENEPTGPK